MDGPDVPLAWLDEEQERRPEDDVDYGQTWLEQLGERNDRLNDDRVTYQSHYPDEDERREPKDVGPDVFSGGSLSWL